MEAIYYSAIRDNITLVRYFNGNLQIGYDVNYLTSPMWSTLSGKSISNTLLFYEYELVGYV